MSHWINHCGLSGEVGTKHPKEKTVREAVLARGSQIIASMFDPSPDDKPGIGGIELMALTAARLAMDEATPAFASALGIDFENNITKLVFDSANPTIVLPEGMDGMALVELAMVRAENLVTSVVRGQGSGKRDKVLLVELVGEQIGMSVLRKGARATARDFDFDLDGIAGELVSRHLSHPILEQDLRRRKLDPGGLAAEAVARAFPLLTSGDGTLGIFAKPAVGGSISVEVMGRHGRNRGARNVAEGAVGQTGESLTRLEDHAASDQVSSC